MGDGARIFSLRGQGNNGPAQQSPAPNYDQRVPSSFGAENTTTGREIGANQIWESERFKMLEYRQRFYECTHHDHKQYDFQGRAINPGGAIAGTQPLLGTAVLPEYVPLDSRRPSNPYRVGRMIVGQFSSFMFGEDVAPVPTSTDKDTDAAVKELAEAQSLVERMLHARDMGGASGSVGLSWRFVDGVPRTTVHPGKQIHIDEWEDEEEGIPSYVVELYQTTRSVYDPVSRKRVDCQFWVRRDWTPEEDIEYEEAQVTEDEPVWVVKSTYNHGDGECHFVWVRNTDSDVNGIDGDPDYAEVYEQMCQIDVLNSVSCSGTIKNLDPTLILKRDTSVIGDTVVHKGSGNGIDVGLAGDAKYLELSGTATAAGKAEFDKQRSQILEECQCVIPDPDIVATAGTSGTALKLLYAPLLARCDKFRVKYGRAMVRLIEQQLRSWRMLGERRYVQDVVDDETGEPKVDPETNEPVQEEVAVVVKLRPRTMEVTGKDDAGAEVTTVQQVEHVPGSGSVTLAWPPYFPASSEDDQKEASSLSTAVGGKPVLSQKTAVDKMASRFGVDPETEWTQVLSDAERARSAQSELFPSFGGGVDVEDDLPPGATEPTVPKVEAPPPPPTKTEPLAVSQETALNGAQVTAMLEIVKSVAERQLPPEVAIQIIVAAFPVDEPTARKIVGPVGTHFFAEGVKPPGDAPPEGSAPGGAG